jgi:hypothetical protein
MSDTDFTVGALRRQLAYLSDETKLSFGGDLTFLRVKRWTDNEVYLEWNEALADLDPAFRKRNPHIQVAFVNTASVDWEDGGLIGSVDVSIR